jgi:hypothetical protein
MDRQIARQHRTARNILRVGQIADRAAEVIGSVHADKHPVGAIVQRGLRGVARLAPKAAVAAALSSPIKREARNLRDAVKKRDLAGGAAAAMKLGGVAKVIKDTKSVTVMPKITR